MFQRNLVTFFPTIKSVERLVSSSSGATPLPCRPNELLIYGIPSLRYHRLHPEYIHQRIERLGQSYNLRILLLMCDIVCPFPTHTHTHLCPTAPQSEHQDPIRELTKVCLLNNITVIVAWS
jgi:DNA repair protein Rad10